MVVAVHVDGVVGGCAYAGGHVCVWLSSLPSPVILVVVVVIHTFVGLLLLVLVLHVLISSCCIFLHLAASSTAVFILRCPPEV